MRLTAPQQRLLDEVKEKGTVHKDGRIRRTVEPMQKAGILQYDFELVPHALGRWTEHYTISLSLKAAAMMDPLITAVQCLIDVVLAWLRWGGDDPEDIKPRTEEKKGETP